MENIEYKLTRIEGEFKEAKIAEYSNWPLQKSIQFPAVMFNVQSKEDLDVIKQYYFQQYPSNHIFGYAVPFHKLASYIPELLKTVPRTATYMCDLDTEIFWHSTQKLKPNIQKFYEEYTAIPTKIKSRIANITSTRKFVDRIEIHKKFWKEIMINKSDLMSLITTYTNRQHGYQIGILSSLGPLLLDQDHIDFVEECYAQTKRLYHNDSAINLENDGKLIGLYSNMHTTFLSKRENVNEFVKMVERTEPKALIFKIFNLEDVRTMRIIKDNYELLINSIGNLSRILHMPTFYFSTHTAGYQANTKGIDVFSEPFNRKPNNEVKFAMNSAQLQMLNEVNPSFKAGKIYDIKTGDFKSRREFQNTRLLNDKIDSPISAIPATYKPDVIKSMTDRHFRDFAKMLLMESRNYEEELLHKSIPKSDLTKIKNKLSLWQGAGIPQ